MARYTDSDLDTIRHNVLTEPFQSFCGLRLNHHREGKAETAFTVGANTSTGLKC